MATFTGVKQGDGFVCFRDAVGTSRQRSKVGCIRPHDCEAEKDGGVFEMSMTRPVKESQNSLHLMFGPYICY